MTDNDDDDKDDKDNQDNAPKEGECWIKKVTSTGKDLFALLRDATLFAIAFLLLIWPTELNNMLNDAGFVEGSLAGFKWKSKLTQSDSQLVSAQATIADLKLQNDNLNKALADAKPQVGNPALKERISSLETINQQLAASSDRVQDLVQSAISANSPLVQKIETASGTLAQWAVVFSGDTTLESAKYEVQKAAPLLGIRGASLYYRQGSYRSVAPASDRAQATDILAKAKQRRADAYIVNMQTWCLHQNQKEGYVECTN